MDNVNYAPQELRIVNRQQNEQVTEEVANLYESLDQSQTVKAKKCCPQLQLEKQAAALALIIILQVLMLIVLIAILVTVYMPTHTCTNVIYSDGNDSNGRALSNSRNIPVQQLDPMETEEFLQKVDKMAKVLSNVSDACISSADVVYEISSTMREILLKQNNTSSDPLLQDSCNMIKEAQLYNQSGYYTINGKSIYCHMGELCGTDAWARLAYLNMSDQNCPSGFRLYQSGGVRACGRPVTNDGSCVSVQFSSNGIKYSQICDRVVGYQYGKTDAARSSNVIVDGVIITRGLSQQHVWTMMAGIFDLSLNIPLSRCPCSTNSRQVFLSDHYFCESGQHGTSNQVKLYTSDPLWDGRG